MIYEDRIETDLEAKAKKFQAKTFTVRDLDKDMLLTMPFDYPERKTLVEMSCDEFTCLCPFSGLPDFARIVISYVPARKLIEMKSLKYYLYAFRNLKVYNEHAVNKIMDDLKKTLSPREITVTGYFTSRGGITNKVTASYIAGKSKKAKVKSKK